jgi:hypothetical protein
MQSINLTAIHTWHQGFGRSHLIKRTEPRQLSLYWLATGSKKGVLWGHTAFYQIGAESFSQGVMRPGREADNHLVPRTGTRGDHLHPHYSPGPRSLDLRNVRGERGGGKRKATEPIRRPLLTLCTQLLSALKILDINHLVFQISLSWKWVSSVL